MLLFSFGANCDDLCLDEFLLLLYFKKYTLSPLCLSLSPYPAIFVFRARGCLSLCLASCTLVSIRELSLGVRETL